MKLAEFSFLVAATPKWVLNTCAVLRVSRRYNIDMAQTWSIARDLHRDIDVPMARALTIAAQALTAWDGVSHTVQLTFAEGNVALNINVLRTLSALNTRRSLLATMVTSRQPGRRAARNRSPMRAATAWGIDVTLLADNRRKTPEERVRQLDAMVAFASSVQRSSPV